MLWLKYGSIPISCGGSVIRTVFGDYFQTLSYSQLKGRSSSSILYGGYKGAVFCGYFIKDPFVG